jgi:hypothetical protein
MAIGSCRTRLDRRAQAATAASMQRLQRTYGVRSVLIYFDALKMN